MDYFLENLDSSTFEKLVNTICQRILGTGVVSFSPGKDGGRDGLFNGKATRFPSDTDQCWAGKFIIQAKHTSNPIASCSDPDFKRLVRDEIAKLTKLRQAGVVDCYLLFTNRKYTGIAGEALRKKIHQETGIPHVAIIGKETINDQYLNSHKDIVRQYSLDMQLVPFDFSDDEIRNIIVALKQQWTDIAQDVKQRAEELKYDFEKIKVEEKNTRNQLGEAYFVNELQGRSLMDFAKIQSFLDNPINEAIKEQYFDIASELSGIITLKRSNFAAFEDIFIYIYSRACDGNSTLLGAKRHVTTLLHYMYVECLIGEK